MTEALFDYPTYAPGFGLANGHLQSIIPSVFRQVEVPFQRSKLELPDGDFLLLDQLKQHKDAPWVVISHGLEGDSRRHYIQGMAREFYAAGWNVMAWNFRGCGGEINRLPRFYHSGAIEDLKSVVHHVLNAEQAEKVFLLGFSMGGNQTVLTLAENDLPAQVVGGAAFSVPLDLGACADELAKPAQSIYMKRFLRDLKVKVEQKAELFPDVVSAKDYETITSFHQFDERYTAPLHGFSSAQDYWQQCSSRKALCRLKRPTLIVNAMDDPFLASSCHDSGLSERCTKLYLETPSNGGHVGFARWRLNQPLWSEQRALAFAHYVMEKSK
ncbi:alpha/beta fold hydrolase [Reinekea forsetii]|nr:alpha/beta fold hydrolase [Reinekea forsetii]